MKVAHPQSGSWSTIPDWIGFWVGFRRVGKTGVPREKPLGARERTSNKLNSHNYAVDAGTWTQATFVGVGGIKEKTI